MVNAAYMTTFGNAAQWLLLTGLRHSATSPSACCGAKPDINHGFRIAKFLKREVCKQVAEAKLGRLIISGHRLENSHIMKGA